MKFIASAFVGSMALCGTAHAQAVFSEFSVGAGFPSSVETAPYSVISTVDAPALGIAVGDDLSGTLSGSYKAGIAGGLEIGMRGVGDKHVSMSVSYDYIQANLHEITASGTINGVPTTSTASLDALGVNGSDFNNEVHLVLGNLRYDPFGPHEQFQPFIGVGGGGAFIENSDAAAALAGTAGVRVPLGLGFYAGVKYRYIKVFGYEDQLGIDYDDMSGHLVSFMLGAQM